MKNILVNTALVLMLLSPCACVEISTPIEPLPGPWFGFGYNQDPQDRDAIGHDAAPWRPEMWELTTRRILAMQPGFVRVNAYREWFGQTEDGAPLPVGVYNWDSKWMVEFYKVLQWYEDQDIPVMTGLWHANLGWSDDPQFYITDGPGSFPQLLADFYQHLLQVRGFTHLRWFTPTNEPAGCGITPDQWSTMMRNLHAEFQRRGLPSNVLTGADSWDEWTPHAARENSVQLAAYDHHKYANDGRQWLVEGKLETYLREHIQAVRRENPSGKPVFLSEVAPSNPQATDWWYVLPQRPEVAPPDPLFGLDTLDMGIQILRSGEAGALAWALDGFDYGKDPGMWNLSGLNGGMSLRLWYYTWSLLCQAFPPGATIYTMTQPENTRIVAAATGTEQGAHWSFAVVNRDPQSAHEVTLQVSGWGAGKFKVTDYNLQTPVDGISLELPYTCIEGSLEEGITLMLPPESGTVITSLPYSSIPVK